MTVVYLRPTEKRKLISTALCAYSLAQSHGNFADARLALPKAGKGRLSEPCPSWPHDWVAYRTSAPTIGQVTTSLAQVHVRDTR